MEVSKYKRKPTICMSIVKMKSGEKMQMVGMNSINAAPDEMNEFS